MYCPKRKACIIIIIIYFCIINKKVPNKTVHSGTSRDTPHPSLKIYRVHLSAYTGNTIPQPHVKVRNKRV